jgi:hypothetical protein
MEEGISTSPGFMMSAYWNCSGIPISLFKASHSRFGSRQKVSMGG